MVNYTNGKIYKIVCLTTNQIYIGSTTKPLSARLATHRADYKLYKQEKYHYVTSFKILEGNNYRIELLEEYKCDNKEQLHAKEGKYIQLFECVNIDPQHVVTMRCVRHTFREHYTTAYIWILIGFAIVACLFGIFK